jgi:uncharacterized protein
MRSHLTGAKHSLEYSKVNFLVAVITWTIVLESQATALIFPFYTMATPTSAVLSSPLPLLSYTPGMDVGELEVWPFINPSSNYVIHDESSPQASGRIDSCTPTSRVGIWKCTMGKFECTEQGDELMTILSGKVIITDVETGHVVELGVGDLLFSRNGKRLIWDVLEDVTKAFYGSKADGY